jgi:hypothetical protein
VFWRRWRTSSRAPRRGSTDRSAHFDVLADGRIVVTHNVFGRTIPWEVLPTDASVETLGQVSRRAMAYEPPDVSDAAAVAARKRECQRLGIEFSGHEASVTVVSRDETVMLLATAIDEGGVGTIVNAPRTLPEDVDDRELGQTIADLLRLLPPSPARLDGPTGAAFGYKIAWLAVRDSTTDSIADALLLEKRASVTWQAGVRSAYGDTNPVFVSPRTGGWVFAVHSGWSDRRPDLASLSGELDTEVQYFATHRVVELQRWARAEHGVVSRELFYVGESGEGHASGQPTEIEESLGFGWVLPIGEALPDNYETPDEQAVMAIAGGWSINPQALDFVPADPGAGILGFLPR